MDSVFQVSGGLTGLWDDDEGRLAFGIGEIGDTNLRSGKFGRAIEKIWNPGETETLRWMDAAGQLIATFERIQRSASWESGTYDDFSNIRVTDCTGHTAFYIQYVPGAGMFKGKHWFSSDPGQYRVLSKKDFINGGALSVAITNETNTRPGGGKEYELVMMEDRSIPHCTDRDPALCWSIATNSMCHISVKRAQRDLQIHEQDTCSIAKKDKNKAAITTCCELACAHSEEQLDKCHPGLAAASPAAKLHSKGWRNGILEMSTVQDWQITVNDRSATGSDPRVLVALATMKTSGARVPQYGDRRRRRGVSYATDNRNVIWLFGSYSGYITFVVSMVALACLCQIFGRVTEIFGRAEHRPIHR